ncbi:hypothetical protein G9A89_012886 [Geosiphon pyriformis]|nr:hypothetical protein G9A89_012886 [Geosiphon pyriformis]
MTIDGIQIKIILTKSGLHAEKEIGWNCDSEDYYKYSRISKLIAFEYQVTGLLFILTPEIITYIILQRTSTNKHHPKVAESENIGTNHLEFVKSLFQHYYQHLGLNHNHISAKSVFNFYVNKKISSLLGTPVNTKAARETFYRELIQNTNLPTNYNFASIITEINKEIEHHTQQKYPITYASKGKGKLQTSAVTPKKIQPLTWKKTRVELPTAPSYYYTLEKEEEKESEDQEFTYQNPITENLEQNLNLENLEIETPNHQRQNNPNPKLINQQNLPPVIIINQLPINSITKPIQQPLQQPQALQAIPYFFQDTANLWYQSLATKPQTFNIFKQEFLRYFSNNNSINRLVNTFTIIKQGDTEAVTTYLGRFHKCLCQIQAINTDYFTVAQILNQFIRGLCNSILQCVRPLHPADLQVAVTNARDFEVAELKVNHAQAINLVINGSSELDSKLKQFSDFINQKLEEYLADNRTIYQPPQQCNNQRNSNCIQNQSRPLFSANQQWQQETRVCHYCVIYQQSQPPIIYQPQQIQTLPQNLPSNRTQRLRMAQQSWRSVMVVHQPIPSSSQQPSELHQQNLDTGQPQNLNSQNYLSLLITPEDTLANNPKSAQKQSLTSNIPPATITKDKFLTAIFPFKFEKTTAMLLFSRATLEAKPITIMYTDAKVNRQSIKLILDSGSADSIITQQLIDQLDH